MFIVSELSKILSTRINLNEKLSVQTSQIQLSLTKEYASKLDTNILLSSGKIITPTFCGKDNSEILLKDGCKKTELTQQVKILNLFILVLDVDQLIIIKFKNCQNYSYTLVFQ